MRRALAAQPTFCAVAVLTLAIGLGAVVAIFSVVDAVLLRPLPYDRADRLVTVWQDLGARGGPRDEWATPGNLADWRAATDVFSGLAAAVGWSPSLVVAGTPEPLAGAQVSADYFAVLRARFVAGRAFDVAEDVPNAPRVVVLGHGLWRARFGGDPGIVGRTIVLGGDPHVVVGVLHPGFRPAVVADAEIFRPLRLNLATPSRGAVVLRIVGRLVDGITFDQAAERMTRLARSLEHAHPDTNHQAGVALIALHERTVGNVRQGLLVLLAAVALVLLIACANVANLFLARGLTRDRELAVRTALGASRGRIVRLLLTEGIVLAAAGGVLGVLLAVWCVQGLVQLASERLPRVDEIAIDTRVLVFAAIVTSATALVFGLVPALRLSARDSSTLREGRRATAAAGLLRRALVIGEVALAVVLLVGAGLMTRSFSKLLTYDLGFDTDHVLAGRLLPPPVRYAEDEPRAALYDQVLDAAAALPGVRSVALTSVVPFGGDSDLSFEIAGRVQPARDELQPVAWYRAVSHGYLDVLGLRLVRGRWLDAREPAPVVVVNETMARRYWPGGDVLNQRLRPGPRAPWFTVVGVVADMRSRGPRAALQAEMFVPYHEVPESVMWILLRTAPADRATPARIEAGPSPASLMAPLRNAVARIDPTVPLTTLQPMDEMASDALAEPRFLAALTSIFGLLALVLGGFGIYGVMAYLVSRRTQEIGVRMALGASAADVLRLIVGESVGLAGVGLAAGIVLSLVLARSLRSLLFGIGPLDPAAFGVAALALLGVVVAASFVPARRAIRIDPHRALRAE